MEAAVPDATIIIPQCGHSELTIACVRSLRAVHAACWPVLVVDDGSPAAALTTLRLNMATIANVTVLPPQRQGVTAAWNRAADLATTPFLVFLNNDTLSDGEWLDKLLQPLRERRGMVSGVRFRRETALPRSVLQRLPTEHFLEGWCFAVAVDDWSGVGTFDERLRLYFSDTDFQARIVKAGDGDLTKLTEVPGLPVRHLGHQTARRMPERNVMWREDRQTFMTKWAGDSEC